MAPGTHRHFPRHHVDRGVPRRAVHLRLLRAWETGPGWSRVHSRRPIQSKGSPDRLHHYPVLPLHAPRARPNRSHPRAPRRDRGGRQLVCGVGYGALGALLVQQLPSLPRGDTNLLPCGRRFQLPAHGHGDDAHRKFSTRRHGRPRRARPPRARRAHCPRGAGRMLALRDPHGLAAAVGSPPRRPPISRPLRDSCVPPTPAQPPPPLLASHIVCGSAAVCCSCCCC